MGEACLVTATVTITFQPTYDAALMPHQHIAWYALKIRTGGEQAAIAALKYRGFAPYCPTQKVRRRYSDRMKVVDVPVFPGYVFCQFDVQKKLPIISSPGVEYILGSADGPTPLPDEELDNIRRMIDTGASAIPSIPTGQRVRVTHGPLAGVEGILVHDATGDRLVVSIQLLNQGASLRINEDQVSPA